MARHHDDLLPFRALPEVLFVFLCSRGLCGHSGDGLRGPGRVGCRGPWSRGDLAHGLYRHAGHADRRAGHQ